MKKKNKSHEVDLFYLKEEEPKKEKKAAGKKRPAKQKKEKKAESEIFSFDDEIVIGVTKIEDKPKKKEKKKKNRAGIRPAPTEKRKKNKKKNYKNAKEVEKQNKKRKKIAFILKLTALFVIILGTILFMLLSPTFNVRKITVKGNEKITAEEIKSLSAITLDENTFKYRLSEITQNIKQQAYIDSVKVSRKFPSEIEIQVIERKPSFMLQIGNAFVYMSSQGYFLEVSETRLEVPAIIGYETQIENIQPGGRLINTDLEKLETVLKIMKNAKANELDTKITQINISNKN